VKFYFVALSKLLLADAWQKALELTVQTLVDAKDPDPKRVYRWWLDAQQINAHESEWQLIVSEMDKANMWNKSSEAELVALAQQIAAPQDQAAGAAVEA
jgi:hypothetical protein